MERLLKEAGKPKAMVSILSNPRPRGYDHALSLIEDEAVIARYRFMDLWIFVPDADRARNLEDIEQRLQSKGIRLLCCAARPELEIWLLSAYASDVKKRYGFDWETCRTHPRLKEEIGEKFLSDSGFYSAAGQGRGILMKQGLAENFSQILNRCEELSSLLDRLKFF